MLKRFSFTKLKYIISCIPNIQLKKYQKKGVQWILKCLFSRFKGGVLADDMGLGKTLQTITAILYLNMIKIINNETPALVIVPKSLLTNWSQEFQRFAPRIKVYIYFGKNRHIPKDTDVIITTYGAVTINLGIFEQVNYSLIVLDEAQYIKNPKSIRAESIKQLKASYKLALTGTPFENKIEDVMSIFDFIKPGYLSRYDKYYTNILHSRFIPSIKKKIKPYILRRLKEDVLRKELQKKTIKVIKCTLTDQQIKLYKEIAPLDATYQQVYKDSGRKGLAALKVICNHPALYTEPRPTEFDIAFMDAYINESGKTLQMKLIIESIREEEKILIFTHSIPMLHTLTKVCMNELKLEVLFLHGAHNRKERSDIVKTFQEQGSKIRILIISLKAGGTGLNLTAANHVIHYDLWWNPAVENQASDRVYRIGQKRPVTIYRLITNNSIEESINVKQKSKQKLADMLLTNKYDK